MIIDFDKVIVKEHQISISPYWGDGMMEMKITLLVHEDAIMDSNHPMELKFTRRLQKTELLQIESNV